MERSIYTAEFKIKQDFAGIIAAEYLTDNYRVSFRTAPTEEWHPDNRSGTLEQATARQAILELIFA